MHRLRRERLLIPAVIAAIGASLLLACSSSAAPERAVTATALRGSIAVVGNGLYRRFPSGRLELLTADGRAPAWSRDGRKIAFVRAIGRPGSLLCALFVMNSDGSDLHRVGQVTTDCSGVSWGPGDRQLVFGRGRSASVASIGLWIVNADGSGLRQLRAGRGATEGMHPAWSPNGRWIVFGWTGRSPHPWGRLAAVRPDGSGYHVLVRPRAGKHDDELTFPAWSPEGTQLAYVRIDHRLGRAGRTIELADAGGHHRRVLAHLPYNPGGQGAPTWSPSGRLLAYWGSCGMSICVLTVPSRGGRPHVLLRGYAEPAWGPAGT